MFTATNTRLGDSPARIITDSAGAQHRLGDLAKRSDRIGAIARLVLATGRVDCPGCNKRRIATNAFFERGGVSAWLCRDCHAGLRRSKKRFGRVVANLERNVPGMGVAK